MGVSDRAATLTYFYFDEPALNTFDESLMEWRIKNTAYEVVKTEKIAVERLDEVLRRRLPQGQSIDFISIDVEGRDFDVVKSNDWNAFRPKCVLIESMAKSVEEDMLSELVTYLRDRDYVLFGKTHNTLIFRGRKFHESSMRAAGPQTA